MARILGIDTGTNSLGWAIVDKDEKGYHLIDRGVNIFQEGVKIDKGIESSKASERTLHKSTRVRYYRIKLRKINLLRILSDNHLCPPLSHEELRDWRLKRYIPKPNSSCNGKPPMTQLERIPMPADTDVCTKCWIWTS